MADKKNGAQPGQAGEAASQPEGRPATKLEGVKWALARMGKDAKPKAIQAFVQKEYGLEMSTDTISTYKRDLAKKGSGKGKGKGKGKKPAARKEPVAAPSAAARPVKGSGKRGSIQLEDILAVKALVQRVGVGQLRILIDALSR
jgi:hypothetical protein